MAKKAYIGIGGKSRNVKAIYVGVDNKARKVVKGYVGDANGKARLFYESKKVGPAFSTIFNADRTYNIPYDGKYIITAYGATGGGGGGGGTYSGAQYSQFEDTVQRYNVVCGDGGAGGQGYVASTTVELKAGDTITITIGVGGNGGAAGTNGSYPTVPTSGSNGKAGGATKVTGAVTLTAKGGGGGGGGAVSTNANPQHGAAGTGGDGIIGPAGGVGALKPHGSLYATRNATAGGKGYNGYVGITYHGG